MRARAGVFLVCALAGCTGSDRVSEVGLPDVDSLWNYQDPAGTRARFQDLLPRAEEEGDGDYTALLQTQIARTYGLEQRFDSAHQLLDMVEPQLEERAAGVRVRYLLERGRTLNSSGDPAPAIPLFQKAWTLARETSLDALAIDAAHMMAIVVPADEQQRWNRQALELAETSEEPRARRWRGSLYNNMGWTYFDQGRYDSALMMFEQAVTLRKAQGQEQETRIARWCQAKTLRFLGRVEESLAIQQELLAAWEQIGEPDGYVYEEIAECLVLLQRDDEAVPHFRRAWELLSEDAWLSRDQPDRLARLQRLGQVE